MKKGNTQYRRLKSCEYVMAWLTIGRKKKRIPHQHTYIHMASTHDDSYISVCNSVCDLQRRQNHTTNNNSKKKKSKWPKTQNWMRKMQKLHTNIFLLLSKDETLSSIPRLLPPERSMHVCMKIAFELGIKRLETGLKSHKRKKKNAWHFGFFLFT